MKQLTPVISTKFKSGNCYLYVEDQEKQKYVLIDHGDGYARFTGIRFQLFTHSKDGEPDSPVDENTMWVLTKSIKGSPFPERLTNVSQPQRSNRKGNLKP